jgi:hypothetical protein
MPKSYTYITRELLDTEAREYFAQQTSWSVVFETEENLNKRIIKLMRKIKELKYALNFPSLSDETRESILTKIKELESSILVEVHLAKVELLDDPFLPEWLLKEENICLEVALIVECVNKQIYWRAIQFRRKLWYEPDRPISCPEANIRLEICKVGFDKDSLCHFQNCSIPPSKIGELPSCAQDQIINLLTKGRFVCINQQTTQQFGKSVGWIESTIGKMNVLRLYEMLLQTYLEKLGDFFKNFTNSLKRTPTSWRRHYRSCLEFKQTFLMLNTLKHLNNLAYYSHLLRFLAKRNKHQICGDIN